MSSHFTLYSRGATGPVLLLLIAGCSTNSADGPTGFAAALGRYDTAARDVVDGVAGTVETAVALDDALLTDDDATIDVAADALARSVSELEAAVISLEQLETEILVAGGTAPEEGSGMITNQQQGLVGIISVGLVIWGTYKYGRKLKEESDRLSEQRKRRDAAEAEVLGGKAGAEERYSQAKQEMRETGERTIRHVATKVTTELVLAPIKPATAVGVVLKDRAGNKLGEAINVIATTEDCRDDPDGDACKISVGRTDASGRAVLATGENVVILSDKGSARVVVKGVRITAASDTEVKRAMIPVDEATPEDVAANDEGTYEPGSGGGTPPPPSPPPSGITLSGTYPDEPFNGMQIDYTIGGVASGTATDTPGFTTSRHFVGQLGGGTLSVSGAARMGNGYDADLTVTVEVDGESASDSANIPTGFPSFNAHEFNVSVPIPAGAKAGSVSIRMTGHYNAGDRGLNVTGAFAAE